MLPNITDDEDDNDLSAPAAPYPVPSPPPAVIPAAFPAAPAFVPRSRCGRCSACAHPAWKQRCERNAALSPPLKRKTRGAPPGALAPPPRAQQPPAQPRRASVLRQQAQRERARAEAAAAADAAAADGAAASDGWRSGEYDDEEEPRAAAADADYEGGGVGAGDGGGDDATLDAPRWEECPFCARWVVVHLSVPGATSVGGATCSECGRGVALTQGASQGWVQCDACGKWRSVAPAVLNALAQAGEGCVLRHYNPIL